MSRVYLRTLLIGSPFFLLNNVLLCFVRNDGAPQRSMAAMLTGSFSNILLDYLLIFLLRMGMFGAVLATCLSPVISIGVLLPFFRNKRNHFHLVKTGAEPGQCCRILAVGSSSLMMELSSGVVMILFNLLLLRLAGNTGVAAYGIIANLSLVVTAVYTGAAQGIQPLVSQAAGAGNDRTARSYLQYDLLPAGGLFLLIYGSLFLFAAPVAGLFNRDGNAALQGLAVQGIRLYFLGAAPAGLNILTTGYLAAVGQTFWSSLISLLRGILLVIPFAFLMTELFQVSGVWLTYPVTEFAVGLLSVAACCRCHLFVNSSESS